MGADVGRCGWESPTLMQGTVPAICALPAGHAGWHREGQTEWGVRQPSADDIAAALEAARLVGYDQGWRDALA